MKAEPKPKYPNTFNITQRIGDAMKKRCEWVGDTEIEKGYHDEEWGVPVHDDRRLFEFLILEGTQAGLSWLTILRKRENCRKAFDRFDPRKMAKYDKRKIGRLLKNEGIIRNKLKIYASINNARAYLNVEEAFGSFNAYIWQFVNQSPILNRWESLDQIPVQTAESTLMSKDLKKRGFSFVGPTICYAFMQAVGMVNDHTVDCFRHREISQQLK